MRGLAIWKLPHLDPTVRSTVDTQLLSLHPWDFLFCLLAATSFMSITVPSSLLSSCVPFLLPGFCMYDEYYP